MNTEFPLAAPIGGSRSRRERGASPPHVDRGCRLRTEPPGGSYRRAEFQPACLTGRRLRGRRRRLGSVPVQAATVPVVPHRGPRIGMRGGLLHITRRHPGVQTGAAVMNACRRVCGVTTLPIPARRRSAVMSIAGPACSSHVDSGFTCPGCGSATCTGRLSRLEMTSAACPAVSWSEAISIRWATAPGSLSAPPAATVPSPSRSAPTHHRRRPRRRSDFTA